MTDLLGLTLVIHPYSNNYDEEDFFLVDEKWGSSLGTILVVGNVTDGSVGSSNRSVNFTN